MKIVIDLLPLEFKDEDIKRAKFYKIQTFGVVTILVLTFLASSTVALRFLQSQRISKITDSLTQSQSKVSELKDTQVSLLLLKDRLTTINKYLGNPSKQVEMYNLIKNLLPASVSVSSISIAQSGDILLLATTTDGAAIDKFITGLTSPDTNHDKVSQVKMESITRGKDGIYRVSLNIKPK